MRESSKKTSIRSMVGVAAIVVVGGLVFAGCGNNAKSDQAATPEQTQSARTEVPWETLGLDKDNGQVHIDDAMKSKDCNMLKAYYHMAISQKLEGETGGSALLDYEEEAIEIAGCVKFQEGQARTVVDWKNFSSEEDKKAIDASMKSKDCKMLQGGIGMIMSYVDKVGFDNYLRYILEAVDIAKCGR